ncbi:MAG: hypothetical protein FWG02_00210 [Holophagaceae bacterium]|nr:hypothetical protein [Holophagaceae bacterium]
MSVRVSTHIDEATKQQFDKVCNNYNGIPFSTVTPTADSQKMSREEMFGCMRVQIWMADDFDAHWKISRNTWNEIIA